MKSKTPLNKQSNKLLLLSLAIIFIAVGFFSGLHLHGTFSQWIYHGKMKVSKFSCFGHTNFWETYQWDCYTPKPNSLSSFKMSDYLNCKELQSLSLNEDTYSETTRKYLSTLSIKTDHIGFTLDIDPSTKTLVRSNTGGEIAKGAFEITKNDENILIALRKIFIEDVFNSENYEQILILKSTGKGMINYYNTADSLGNAEALGMRFILCE